MSDTVARRRVLLVGATGVVGTECLRQLAADDSVALVRALVRRPLADAPAKVEVVVTDMRTIESHPEFFAVDQVVCALGTTIKVAGSPAAFRAVDYELPLRVAQLARAQGATHFLLVSALGASTASGVFYNRVKGELEDALGALGFRSLTIARPSLLLGDRAEFRLGERIAQPFGFLIPPRWKPVHARQVAAALVSAGRQDLAGRCVIENIALRRHCGGTEPSALPRPF